VERLVAQAYKVPENVTATAFAVDGINVELHSLTI
jgi:hypothetical protein